MCEPELKRNCVRPWYKILLWCCVSIFIKFWWFVLKLRYGELTSSVMYQHDVKYIKYISSCYWFTQTWLNRSGLHFLGLTPTVGESQVAGKVNESSLWWSEIRIHWFYPEWALTSMWEMGGCIWKMIASYGSNGKGAPSYPSARQRVLFLTLILKNVR